MEKIDIQADTNQGEFSCRAASLIINDNKLLVAKHKDHPCYYIVGGGVKLNETSAEAVVGEVFEETGYTLEIERLAFVQERFYEYCDKCHHEIVFFYIMKYSNEISIIDGTFTDQGEKETLHWLPIDKLEDMNIVPSFVKTSLTKRNENIIHIISKE